MSLRRRFEVFQRDSFTCRYCGNKSPDAILELDHVIPLSKGGLDEFENLLTACFECNRGKGARLLDQKPLEIDLHDQTILIAERELQLREYTHWRMKQRQREDEEIRQLRELWESVYPDEGYCSNGSLRTFVRRLGFVETWEAMEWVFSLDAYCNAKRDWLYFCKRCWNLIKGAAPVESDDALSQS